MRYIVYNISINLARLITDFLFFDYNFYEPFFSRNGLDLFFLFSDFIIL
jgi:hypothetical protein